MSKKKKWYNSLPAPWYIRLRKAPLKNNSNTNIYLSKKSDPDITPQQ